MASTPDTHHPNPSFAPYRRPRGHLMKNLNTRTRYVRGTLFVALYLASIIVAAWAVVHIGVVPVGLGLMAPAAAYVVGVTMVLRDLAQDQLGPRWVFAAMVVATALSALVSPAVALASALAFIASETLDMLVYTPIRRRGKIITAVLASNAVAIVADSTIFLQVAFGDLSFFWGQTWAKAVSTALVAALLTLIYARRTDKRPAYVVHREALARQEAAA